MVKDNIVNDLKYIYGEEMKDFNSTLHYLKFDYNEKQVLLNNIKNENSKLSKNIDLEIEKHNIFQKQIIYKKTYLKQIELTISMGIQI